MRQGATKGPSQFGSLCSYLKLSLWSEFPLQSGLSLCLFVGFWKGTEQLRAPKGAQAETSRNSSGNAGLGQVSIVSTAFYQSK